MGVKRIVVLGSTGSIGINTLKVVERFPQKFKIVGLTAYNNFKLLEKQIKKFSPTHVAANEKGRQYLKKRVVLKEVKLWDVFSDLERLVSLNEVDVVVVAMRGSAALPPFLSALNSGKTVASANKEALVIAGDVLRDAARRNNAKIIPIDSEQSAIFQCLEGQNVQELKKVYLTASGGTLLNVPESRFDKISVKEILNHPRWKMGKKITVDSATLMNKGFEVIEAMVLFQLNVERIQVVVHPEAIIHSMVEFNDGSIIAQLGVTDMRLPIQYALTYPERFNSGLKAVDFFKLQKLTFQKPDLVKFPSLQLAINVGKRGGTLPSVLNAADEEAVDAFLNGKIKLTQIYKVVEKVVLKHRLKKNPKLDDIFSADQWAREKVKEFLNGVK